MPRYAETAPEVEGQARLALFGMVGALTYASWVLA